MGFPDQELIAAIRNADFQRARLFASAPVKCLVQDLIPGTRFEMKSESLSIAIGLGDKLCEKEKLFSLIDTFTLDIGRPYKCSMFSMILQTPEGECSSHCPPLEEL